MTRAKPSIKCAENERLCHYQAHPVGRAGRRKNTRVSIVVRVFCCSSGYDLHADSLNASAKNVSGPLFFSLLAKRFSRLWGCRLIAQVARITDAHRIQNKTLWSRPPPPQWYIAKRFKRRRLSIEKTSRWNFKRNNENGLFVLQRRRDG